MGAKLRPAWLTEVLTNGGAVRPYMATRMPQFGTENVQHLVVPFEKVDGGTRSHNDSDATAAKFGRKLVGVGGLTCVACHTFAGHASLGVPAIDLATTATRLQPEWFRPYNKMGQSASGIACDVTSGRFGPFKEQLFVGDQTHSTVMRVFLEKINGRYQGACFPFRQGFDSGNLALEFASDASLFVYGTDRGWGARGGKPFALQRLVWTGRTPFEVQEMRIIPTGFELAFTEPADPQTAGELASYKLETYS